MATLVPCDQCGKINRVSISRAEAETAICGACKRDLPIEHGVVHLSGASLQHLLAHSTLPVVVDFWSPTCVPCRVFEPEFRRTAQMYDGRIVFGSVNTASHFLAADQYVIRSVPTLIYFENGAEVERRLGALSSVQLNQWLEILSGSAAAGNRPAA